MVEHIIHKLDIMIARFVCKKAQDDIFGVMPMSLDDIKARVREICSLRIRLRVCGLLAPVKRNSIEFALKADGKTKLIKCGPGSLRRRLLRL